MTRVGIVLCNIGGPWSADLDVVEQYLKTFFRDPAILPVRQPLRWLLSRRIARRRAPESAKNYAAIGGRSPLLDWTEAQRQALEARLAARRDGNTYRCAVAMRYARPTTEEAIDALDREGFRDLVVLPLYPQESCASTGSALSEVDRVIALRNDDRGRNALHKRAEVRSFETHPRYVEAVVERVEDSLTRIAHPGAAHLLFSAHGLPQSYVDAGDPYQRHVEATVAAVVKRLTERREAAVPRSSISYQSRVGPQRWLEPDTAVEVQRLAKEGTRGLVVVPISFVSDHVETLHEIGMQLRALAERAGITEFACTTGLNDSATFVRALEDLVASALEAAAARA